MKTPHYGFIFKSAKHLIMCFSLLSFAITANAVETTKPPVPVEGRLVVTGSVALSNSWSFFSKEINERFGRRIGIINRLFPKIHIHFP